MNLPKICVEVCALVKETATFIQGEVGKVNEQAIEEKFLNNLVSYVDKTAEERLVKCLQRILPEAGFIAEENTITINNDAPYQWIVDPLDGTTNFLRGIPCFAISIGLLETQSQEMILGVVHEINRSECFYAWKGGGAYLNGQAISVSQVSELRQSLTATGFPYYDFSFFDEYNVILQHLMRNTKGVRRLGSAAVDLCYVACGRFDGFYEHSLQAWDVSAGSLIVQEAGGQVTDFEGKGNFLFDKQIVATNWALREPFRAIIQQHIL